MLSDWEWLDKEEQENMFCALKAYYCFFAHESPDDDLERLLEECADNAKDEKARDMLEFWSFEVGSRNKVRKKNAR